MKTEFQFTEVEVPDKAGNGQTIRRLRNIKGMSLRALAEALDVSAPYLSDLEHGNRGFSQPMFEKAKQEISKFKPTK